MQNQADLTPKDAARILGVSESFVRNYAKQGKISHIKIGVLYRFTPEDINQFKQRIECKLNPTHATEPTLE